MSSPPLTQLPNPIRPAFEQGTTEGSVIVNIGPSHPATHGTIQIVAELSGERVIRTAFPGEQCRVEFIGSTQRDAFVQEVRHFKISGAADATQQQLKKICEDLATRSPLRTESHTEQHEGGFRLKVVVSQ